MNQGIINKQKYVAIIITFLAFYSVLIDSMELLFIYRVSV